MLISRSLGHRGRPRARAAWFGDPAASGGILFELGSHDIDLQQAMAGPAGVGAGPVRARAGAGGRGAGRRGGGAAAIRGRRAAGSSVAWTEQQQPPVYELDVLAPDVALHLALDPVFRLAGRAHGGAVDQEAAADPRTSAVTGFLDAARREIRRRRHARRRMRWARCGRRWRRSRRCQRGDGQAGRVRERRLAFSARAAWRYE